MKNDRDRDELIVACVGTGFLVGCVLTAVLASLFV